MKYIQAILIIIGITLFGAALLAHKKALEVANWQATSGSLFYAYTQILLPVTVAGASDRGTKKAIILYRYSVNGEVFTGDKLMLLDFIYFPENKIRVLGDRNKKIIIYFNPKNPADSLIHKDYPHTSISMIVIAGMLFLLVGISLRGISALILNSLYSLR